MFSADGKQPRAGTVARQLLDRKCDADEFPTEMVLSCNPKAYVCREELKRIVSEGIASRPTPIILKLDDYTFTKRKYLSNFVRRIVLTFRPPKEGGHQENKYWIKQRMACVISMLQTAILCACWRLTLQQTRGLPKTVSRVELAKLVNKGWGNVPPFVLKRSAIKCHRWGPSQRLSHSE